MTTEKYLTFSSIENAYRFYMNLLKQNCNVTLVKKGTYPGTWYKVSYTGKYRAF